MPRFIQSHWWELFVLPFVVIPLLTAMIKMIAKHKFTVEREDWAVGFDLLLAVAASTLCFWAALYKETAPPVPRVQQEAGVVNPDHARIAQKKSDCRELLVTLSLWVLLTAFAVKLFGWMEQPMPLGWAPMYRLTEFGVVFPIVIAAGFIWSFCSILGS